jgi:hypothetical protein
LLLPAVMQSSQSPGFRRQDIKDAAGASLSVLLGFCSYVCVCVRAERKSMASPSALTPPGIDIYPQHFVPIQHGSGGFIEKKMVVSRRSCSTLYMVATFIAVDVLLPHGFFLPKVFFFSWAGPGISVAIVHQPKDRSSLPLNHRLCILYTARLCVLGRTIRSRFYIY